ncbi:MAG: serine/threonine-protein kinase, partial [Myxococcota bacterium]
MTPGTETLADGRYTLVEVLGEGGMASVWRAHDARLDCERAVKLLQPRLASVAELRARFETEARTMARLSHPNIVAVHDVGEDRGRIFIVMELLEGGTLAGWQVEHGVMPPRLVVDVILGVLGAVSAAHEAGVVHRDLKPQNVLLSRRGTPKVADFGIAHVTQEMGGSTPTRTGQVLGTLGFMPPEQRLGSRGLDGRADIYAVGAMLYSLATGLPPPDLFASNEDEAMLTPVPPSLLPVVVRATRYKPETRYGTAEEMIAELDAVRRTLPEPPADTPPLVAPGLARGPATTGSGRSTSGAGRSSAGRTGSTPATPPPASQTFVERPGGGTIVALEPDAPPPPVPPTTPSPLASRTPMIAVGA